MNQHVVKRGQDWGVLGEGNKRTTSLHPTQSAAFEAAKQIAGNQSEDVLIHGRNGRIRERNTYGKPDPFPPRG